MPQVTVLMPVYNAEKYLREAIESILNQTFTDFEFLIINDGSTDSSKEISLSYSDSRIRYVENEKNLGIIDTLNKGIDLAKGEYIARMDADDISLSERLQKQVAFMNKNQDIDICGSQIKIIGAEIYSNYAINNDDIRIMLLENNHLAHPTVIVRKHKIKQVKYSNYKAAEDYKLWIEMAKYSKLANIDKPLLHYRYHQNQISNIDNEIQIKITNKIRIEQLVNLNITPSVNEQIIHLEMLHLQYLNRTSKGVKNLNKWLNTLYSQNKIVKYYNKNKFYTFLYYKWRSYIKGLCFSEYNLNVLFIVFVSKFTKLGDYKFKSMLHFTIKCLIHWKNKS